MPWRVVVANISVTHKDGKYVGESGTKLKNDWISKGYNLKKVKTIWNHKGHTGYAGSLCCGRV